MLNIRNSYRTKPWIVTISVGFFVLLYFLIIWLLLGQIDLLDMDYLVPANGILWKGKITNENVEWIWNKYHDIEGFVPDISDLKELIGKNYEIISFSLIFNPNILIYVFCGIIFSIIYPLFFKIFKMMNIDVITFSLSASFICSCFLISDLIPYWGNNNEFWRFLIKFLISSVIGLIVFFITNWIVNKFFVNASSAQLIANELKNEKKQSVVYNEELKKLLDSYKNENNKDYTEIETKGK